MAKSKPPWNQGPKAIPPEDVEDQKIAVLAMVRELGVNRRACDEIGVPYRTFKDWLREDPEFSDRLKLARGESTDDLIVEARTRATHGTPKLKFHAGKQVMVPDPTGATEVVEGVTQSRMVPYVEYEKSDMLLMFILRRDDPSFRDRAAVDIPVIPEHFIEIMNDVISMLPTDKQEAALEMVMNKLREVASQTPTHST